MYLKRVLLSALAFASLSAAAQDKIYKRNGDVIDAKVKEINTRSISYKKADNPDGPSYVIEKSEVDKITYNNGSEDYISGRAPRGKPASNIKYGNNIISAALLNMSDYGLGFGLAYERVLDKNGYLSLYLPVSVSMLGFEPSYGGDYLIDPLGVTENSLSRNQTIYQFMPGIKFYPTTSRGKARYAIGAQFYYAKGEIETPTYYPLIYPGPVPSYPDRFNVERTGGLITNSVNITPNAHMYIGIDLGLGFTYTDKEEMFYNGSMIDHGTQFIANFNFRLGYRF